MTRNYVTSRFVGSARSGPIYGYHDPAVEATDLTPHRRAELACSAEIVFRFQVHALLDPSTARRIRELGRTGVIREYGVTLDQAIIMIDMAVEFESMLVKAQVRVKPEGKKAAGCLLDGREWKESPK